MVTNLTKVKNSYDFLAVKMRAEELMDRAEENEPNLLDDGIDTQKTDRRKDRHICVE